MFPFFFITFWLFRRVYLWSKKETFAQQASIRYLSASEITALSLNYPIIGNYMAVYCCEGETKKAFSLPYSGKIHYRVNYLFDNIRLLIPTEMEIWIKPNEVNRIEFVFIGLKAIAIKINDVDISYLTKKEENRIKWLAQQKGVYFPYYNEMVRSHLKNQLVSDEKISRNPFFKNFFYQVIGKRALTSKENKNVRTYNKSSINKVIYLLFGSSISLAFFHSTLLNFFFYFWVILTVFCLVLALLSLIKGNMQKRLDYINKVIGTITSCDITKQEFVLNNELIIRFPKQWQEVILQDVGKSVTLEVNVENNCLISYNDFLSLKNEKQFTKNYDLPLLKQIAKSATIILFFTLLSVTSNNLTNVLKVINDKVVTNETASHNNVVTLQNASEMLDKLYKQHEIVKFDNVPAICIKSYDSDGCAMVLIVDEESLRQYVKNYPIADIFRHHTEKMDILEQLTNNTIIKYDEITNKVSNVNELDFFVARTCTFYLRKKSAECKELESIIRRIKFNNATSNDLKRYIDLMKYNIGNELINAILPLSVSDVEPLFTQYIKKALFIKMDETPLLPAIGYANKYQKTELLSFYLNLLDPNAKLATLLSFSATITSMEQKFENDADIYSLELSNKIVNKQSGMKEDIHIMMKRTYFSVVLSLFVTIFLLYFILKYIYVCLRTRY